MKNFNENLIPLAIGITCLVGVLFAVLKIIELFTK